MLLQKAGKLEALGTLEDNDPDAGDDEDADDLADQLARSARLD